jgi:hypothetical protein
MKLPRFIRHLLRLNVRAHFTERTACESEHHGAIDIVDAIAVAAGYGGGIPPEIDVTLYDDREPRYLWRPFEVRYLGGGWNRISFGDVEDAINYCRKEKEAVFVAAKTRNRYYKVMRSLGMPAWRMA